MYIYITSITTCILNSDAYPVILVQVYSQRSLNLYSRR